MKTLYMECSTGASGDMISGSLAALLPNPSDIVEIIEGLGIPGVNVSLDEVEKSGIAGYHLTVKIHGSEEDCPEHAHKHHGTTLTDVRQILNFINVSDYVRKNANEIYDLLAEAESKAHGVKVENVHFHEVGMLDAVTDIVAACIMIEHISPEQIIVSPIHTGTGHVKCAHGIMPIPAPATEYLLRGIPCYAGDVEGEFCTPTGAAILKHFADRFENMPLMIFEKTGYGMGKHDYPMANFMRAYLGHTPDSLPETGEIVCNIDDMTAEDLAYAAENLIKNGALDAFITPIIMKKGRPGSMLTCICRTEDIDRFAKQILKETTTIGMRVGKKLRYEMKSSVNLIQTAYGPIHYKKSEGYGILKEKPEYEDLAEISRKTSVPITSIRKNL